MAPWLQIRGHITVADGKTWAFENPCLTTRDARDLGGWLREVAAGTVPPSPVADGEPEGALDFLEPNIAFSVEERTADRVRIRIYFSLESLPPWLQNAEVSGPFEYFVRLEVSAEELTRQPSRGCWNWRSFPSSSRQTSRATARASTLPTAADGNGDSNSSNQRQASAVSSTHGHRMLCGDLALCPALADSRGSAPSCRDCSQHCSQAAGRRPTHVDNSGISAQPTTGDGRSWTTCPLLRISPWYRWRGAVPAYKCLASTISIMRTYLRVRRLGVRVPPSAPPKPQLSTVALPDLPRHRCRLAAFWPHRCPWRPRLGGRRSGPSRPGTGARTGRESW